MALITACSDSPSKLKTTSPPWAGSGGRRLAADSLMKIPVPRSTARRESSAGVSSVSTVAIAPFSGTAIAAGGVAVVAGAASFGSGTGTMAAGAIGASCAAAGAAGTGSATTAGGNSAGSWATSVEPEATGCATWPTAGCSASVGAGADGMPSAQAATDQTKATPASVRFRITSFGTSLLHQFVCSERMRSASSRNWRRRSSMRRRISSACAWLAASFSTAGAVAGG